MTFEAYDPAFFGAPDVPLLFPLPMLDDDADDAEVLAEVVDAARSRLFGSKALERWSKRAEESLLAEQIHVLNI